MRGEDNPHTERFPFCNVVYWKGGTACGKLDAWDRASVECFGQFPSIDCTTTSGVKKIVSMMEVVYDLGKLARSREIRDLLGIDR